MYDAEITFLVIFVLLNVNYFRQNCMESIYVKCVLHVFASTYCTCTMYLSTGLHSVGNLSTLRTRKKKKRIQSFLMMLLF